VVLDNNTLLVKGVDDGIGLGAFSVVLSYTGNVSIQSVEGESGFMVASNIQNDDFQTFIAGIATEGKTGDIQVATVRTEGTGDIDVLLRELANVNGDPITCTNEEFGGLVPAPESDSGISVSEISVSQPEETPIVTPVTPTETATEDMVSETEIPVDTLVPTTTPSATQVALNDDDSPVVPVPSGKSVPPTQSPFNLIVVLSAIGSVFIFKNKK